jgi:hypothetical protein
MRLEPPELGFRSRIDHLEFVGSKPSLYGTSYVQLSAVGRISAYDRWAIRRFNRILRRERVIVPRPLVDFQI